MASSPRVLKIARSDVDDHSCILLHVSSDGPAPLDLRLLATEGSNPYVGSVKQNRLSKLRAKNYKGDDEEWESILLETLSWTRSNENLDGVDLAASVSEAEEASIVLRKHIDGITQRLGTISLLHDETQEIQLFDWAGIASDTASSTKHAVASLESQVRSQQESIATLKNQLDDLIHAKEEHENALLAKFRELLNNKKLKIRDQQRLLNSAKIDPARAAELRSARGGTLPRVAGSSRAVKRKAETHSTEPDVEGSDTDGSQVFAQGDEAAGQLQAQQATPDRSDEEETTDEENEGPNDGRTHTTDHDGVGAKARAVEEGRGDVSVTKARRRLSPPPPRTLPFAKKANGDRVTGTIADEGEDTAGETDDDEL